MKIRAKRSEVSKKYRCLYVTYCGLQDELSLLEPKAYTAGACGWCADLYELPHNYMIVTGYQPFGKVRLTLTAGERERIEQIQSNYSARIIDKPCGEYLVKEVLAEACQRCWYGGR